VWEFSAWISIWWCICLSVREWVGIGGTCSDLEQKGDLICAMPWGF